MCAMCASEHHLSPIHTHTHTHAHTHAQTTWIRPETKGVMRKNGDSLHVGEARLTMEAILKGPPGLFISPRTLLVGAPGRQHPTLPLELGFRV
jgi:hypothetical protein